MTRRIYSNFFFRVKEKTLVLYNLYLKAMHLAFNPMEYTVCQLDLLRA